MRKKSAAVQIDGHKVLKLIEQVQAELIRKIEQDSDHVTVSTNDDGVNDTGQVNWQIISEEDPPQTATNVANLKRNGGAWTKHFISLGINEYNQNHETKPGKIIKKTYININVIHNGKQKSATIFIPNKRAKQQKFYKNVQNFIKKANDLHNDITIREMDNLLVKLNSGRIDEILVGDKE